MQLQAPELHTARAQVLDYFAAQRQRVPPRRLVFRFEQSMDLSEGDATLLRQLCLHTAFPTEPAATLLPAYLSGESRLVLENFPELGAMARAPVVCPVVCPDGRGWPRMATEGCGGLP